MKTAIPDSIRTTLEGLSYEYLVAGVIETLTAEIEAVFARDLVSRARNAMIKIERETGADRFDDFFAVARDARGLAAMMSKIEVQIRNARTDAAVGGFVDVLDATLSDPVLLDHGMRMAGDSISAENLLRSAFVDP